ncbi:MAG: cyclic nucleotide-binding domain-containing protein, partial [Bacteroidota bacterium]
MNGNTIARRVYDFLKDIPPFTFVEEEALLRVSGRIEVQYAPKDHIVFRPGESPKQRFFVVRQGAVELVLPDEEGEEQLVERCGEGEIFGIRPLLAEDTYTLLARAAEDSLLYAVNSEGFKEVLQKYPDVLSYLANSMAVLGRRRSYHYSRYPTDDITPRPKRFLY